MSTPRDPGTRKLLIVCAGIASCAMLLAAIALLVWVTQERGTGPQRNSENAAVADANAMKATNPRPNPESVAVTDASVVKATNPLPNTESAKVADTNISKPAAGGKRF